MAKAKKLPSGSWNVVVFAGYDKDGKRIRKSFTAPTKKEVEYLAAEFQARHKEIVRDKSAMTLSEGIDKYIEFKGNTLSPSTVRGYKLIQRNGLQSIMNIKMHKLTVETIQAAINEEVGNKKQKTINNEIGLVKSVLKMYAPNLSLNGLTLPQKEKFEAAQMTLQEVAILVKEMKNDMCAVPLYLTLCGGLRASELIALKWSDYDPQTMTIYIKKAIVPDKDNNLVQKSTKNSSSTRNFEIPLFLAEMLNGMTDKDPDSHIVTHTQQTIRNHLTHICQKNHLPHIRLHDLRHINASVMAYLGIPQKYAMERGGWDNVQTMDKIYQFTFKDAKKAVDDKINDFFTKLFEG